MIETFFPVNLAKAESYWLGEYLLNETFFPPSVAEQCPEVVVNMAGYNIRQPILAVNAILGTFVGLKGGFELWGMVDTTEENKAIGKRHQRIWPATTRVWSAAFVCFGVMNLSALPLHCFLPAPQTTYPDEVRMIDGP